MADDDDIDVKIQLHDELSAPARVAAESLNELERAARRARESLNRLQAQVRSLSSTMLRGAAANDKYTASLNKQTAALKLNNSAQNSNQRSVTKNAAAHTKHSKETKKAERSTISFSKVLKRLTSIARLCGVGVLYLSAAMAVLAAVGSLVSGAQSLGAVISVLGSLAAFAFFIPTALGSLVAVLLTMKLALKGVGEGIGAAMSGDWQKFDEVLKKVSPSARTFLKVIAKFVPQFKQLQLFVQEAFFRNISKSIEPLLKVQLPLLRSGMALVADSAGKFVREFLGFLSSGSGKTFVSAFFVGGADLIDGLKSGLTPLLLGLSALVDHLAPKWKDFTKTAGTWMKSFGDWLLAIVSDGRLDRWLAMAEQTAKGLWEIFKNLWSILQSVFTAMGDGVFILTSFGFVLGLVAQYLKSAEGQEALLTFFAGLSAILAALQPVMSVLIDSLANVIVPSLIGIITGLAPGFTIFLDGLSIALAALIPYWPMLAKGVGDLLAALAPLLVPLGQLLGLLGGYLGKALEGLAAIIQPLIEAAIIPLTQWLSLAAQVFETEGPMIDQVIQALAQTFASLIPFATEFADLLAEQFAIYFPQVMNILSMLIPVVLRFAEAYGETLGKALELLAPMLPDLVEAFFQIIEQLILLVPALLPVIDSLTTLLTDVIIPNLPFLMEFIGLIIKLIIIFLVLEGGVIRFVVTFIAYFAQLEATTINIFSKMFGFLVAPFRLAFEFIKKNFIDPLLNAFNLIRDGINGAKGDATITGGARALPGRWMGGPVEAGTQYMTGELGPEIFVDNRGNTKMLGEYGPRVEQFVNPGFVVPNHLMDSFASAQASMAKSQSELNSKTSETFSSGQQQPAVVMQDGDTYQVDVHFHGKVDSEIDIERTIRRTIKRVRQEEKERS